MALDAPFRRAILLRYLEGRPAPEIARMLGVPEGTVRWRIKEALDRLRADLDARIEGGRKAWLALIPWEVAARPVAPPAAASSGHSIPTSLTTGGLFMAASVTLRGRVVEYGSGAPVAGARIRGGGDVVELKAVADATGAFELPGAPPGRDIELVIAAQETR
jgi:hypothetical protein